MILCDVDGGHGHGRVMVMACDDGLRLGERTSA